jgi:hypothetical protein
MQITKFILVTCIVTIGAFSLKVAPTIAGEQPNILIMGEDVDTDTSSRNTRIYRRVLDALTNELHYEGFKVFDETAVTLDGFVQGRTRRSDAEIIDIARSIQEPPIDIATIFTIYASSKTMRYTTKIRTRITGRLLNVKDGQRLGNFEVELPMPDNAPVNCNKECILEIVSKNAKMLAQDLGVILATKLRAISPIAIIDVTNEKKYSSNGLDAAYSLIFSGFSTNEINFIEEYFVAFSGYKQHRPVTSTLRTHEYWYETTSDIARLNRNLRMMLEHLGTKGRVVLENNKFIIEKINTVKKRN